jgi:hypothetical protein
MRGRFLNTFDLLSSWTKAMAFSWFLSRPDEGGELASLAPSLLKALQRGRLRRCSEVRIIENGVYTIESNQYRNVENVHVPVSQRSCLHEHDGGLIVGQHLLQLDNVRWAKIDFERGA